MKIPDLQKKLYEMSEALTQIEKDNGYVDSSTVSGYLDQAHNAINDSLRYRKPDGLNLPWSEMPSEGLDDEFDSYVFDGSMSEADYDRMHELRAEASALDYDLALTAHKFKQRFSFEIQEAKDAIDLAKYCHRNPALSAKLLSTDEYKKLPDTLTMYAYNETGQILSVHATVDFSDLKNKIVSRSIASINNNDLKIYLHKVGSYYKDSPLHEGAFYDSFEQMACTNNLQQDRGRY